MCLLLAGIPAFGQFFSIGVKGGVPLTSAYQTFFDPGTPTSYDRPYIIGPTAEVHLPLHLSFEVDALYRRNGFTYFSTGRMRVNDWEIPFLGRYEFASGPIRPFVDAGITYRHVGTSGLPRVVIPPTNSSSAGFSLGGGLTLKLLIVRLSPEIRYTHWGTPPFENGSLLSTTNQADFLVGFTF